MLDIIGILYTAGEYDPEGEVITPPEALSGWHVNSPFKVKGWSAYQTFPETPTRVFGGAPTFFYVFSDEAMFLGMTQVTSTDEEGNPVVTPIALEPEEEPEPTSTAVPFSVSPRQIRMAMSMTPYGEGTLRDTIEATIAAASQEMQDWWNYSTSFERSHEHVNNVAAALGVSSEQVDALWILAGGL